MEKESKPWYAQVSTWAGISTVVGAIGSMVTGVALPVTGIPVVIGGILAIMYPEKRKVK